MNRRLRRTQKEWGDFKRYEQILWMLFMCSSHLSAKFELWGRSPDPWWSCSLWTEGISTSASKIVIGTKKPRAKCIQMLWLLILIACSKMFYCYCFKIVFIDSVSKGKIRTQDKKTRSSIANKVKRKVTKLVCVTLKRSRRLIQDAAHNVSVTRRRSLSNKVHCDHPLYDPVWRSVAALLCCRWMQQHAALFATAR